MSEDRSRVAPEMTPLVDGPAEDPRPGPVEEPPAPGEVPGPETRLEGRSRLGTTSGADETDEGDGRRREEPESRG
jgi:hypothetical protein